MSQFRFTEDFEEMLANYMDSFTNRGTLQFDTANLWKWWKDNRHKLPARRLIRLHREKAREQSSPPPPLGQ